MADFPSAASSDDRDDPIPPNRATAPKPAVPPVPRYNADGTPERPPFSRWAIWGFVVSCVGLFTPGIVGALGVALAVRGLSQSTKFALRGRRLAFAAIIIGAVDFLYFAFTLIAR
jgi:hypothetical protein